MLRKWPPDLGATQRRPTAPEAHAEMGTRETRNASDSAVATSNAGKGRRRGRRVPTTRERERCTSDFERRRDDERRKRRPTTPEVRAEMGTRETQNASNAVVATSDASEGRRCGGRVPPTHKRKRFTIDLWRRCDDERRKRRPTATEAHAEVGTRETQNPSNVVGQRATRGSRRRGRRALTTHERERRASGLRRCRDEERRKRRPTATEAHAAMRKHERRETQAPPSRRRATQAKTDEPETQAEVGTRETRNASNAVVQRAT